MVSFYHGKIPHSIFFPFVYFLFINKFKNYEKGMRRGGFEPPATPIWSLARLSIQECSSGLSYRRNNVLLIWHFTFPQLTH